MARHKWSGRIIARRIDGGVQQCVKCGYTKQYVKGIATYFRDDNVKDRYAPKCDERLLKSIKMEDQKYYIRQEGYCGNALFWWPQNRQGYVTDIRKAGKFTYEEAQNICQRDSDTAYPCEYIDSLLDGKGKKLIIDAQYVSSAERLFVNS